MEKSRFTLVLADDYVREYDEADANIRDIRYRLTNYERMLSSGQRKDHLKQLESWKGVRQEAARRYQLMMGKPIPHAPTTEPKPDA